MITKNDILEQENKMKYLWRGIPKEREIFDEEKISTVIKKIDDRIEKIVKVYEENIQDYAPAVKFENYKNLLSTAIEEVRTNTSLSDIYDNTYDKLTFISGSVIKDDLFEMIIKDVDLIMDIFINSIFDKLIQKTSKALEVLMMYKDLIECDFINKNYSIKNLILLDNSVNFNKSFILANEIINEKCKAYDFSCKYYNSKKYNTEMSNYNAKVFELANNKIMIHYCKVFNDILLREKILSDINKPCYKLSENLLSSNMNIDDYKKILNESGCNAEKFDSFIIVDRDEYNKLLSKNIFV